ncbi:hypothetical protein [Candidatus Finniella inopinata]|uniref:Uncharacterized protein n=1 Tax=Candidatus Finniella inopinata TaxID=1696036 RepID=A0A4Q7DJP4_9PROT|nr:hypothetical protein [Candidatus Finniella inopinata]RZI46375.1 hypothetical protein EQU50_01945 [Candidatus Finniella inopinata]
MNKKYISIFISVFLAETPKGEAVTLEGVTYDVIESIASNVGKGAVKISLAADASAPGAWLTLEHSDGTQAGWQHIRPGGNYIWPAPNGSAYHQVIAPHAANAALYPSTVGWLDDYSHRQSVSPGQDISGLGRVAGNPSSDLSLPTGAVYATPLNGEWVQLDVKPLGNGFDYIWAWKYYVSGSPPTLSQIRGLLTISNS